MRPAALNLRAVHVAASLLESDELKFHNILLSTDRTYGLDLSFDSNLFGATAYAEAAGQLEVWWEVQIDARSWGIKQINPVVTKAVLDGSFLLADENGDIQQTDMTFHYEYPEQAEIPYPASDVSPDADPDEPTPAVIDRLSTVKWSFTYERDRYVDADRSDTLIPRAEVDLTKHVITILF